MSHERVDQAVDRFRQTLRSGASLAHLGMDQGLQPGVEAILDRVQQRLLVGEARVERADREIRPADHIGDGERLDAHGRHLVFGGVEQSLQ